MLGKFQCLLFNHFILQCKKNNIGDEKMNMDTSTIAMIIGFFVVISLFKFILKLPIYLITFGVLGALAYGAYKYLYGM